MVAQVICNHWVGGSTPLASFEELRTDKPKGEFEGKEFSPQE